MMKMVHTADMVAHLWANRAQDSARTSGQNFYFNGAALMSYGQHFVIAAHLDNGRILWNDATYSNTTSRQQTLAWRALTDSQRIQRVYVPEMNYDALRNLQRCKESPDGKTLPDLAQRCAAAVVNAVQSMAKMREGCGPIGHAWFLARKYESSGRALCEYVAKGKKAPAWPLPSLPDTIPTGDDLRAMIRTIARGRMLADFKADADNAASRLAGLARDIADNPDNWRVQNFPGTLEGIARNLTSAQKHHKIATGKNSGRIALLWKQHKALSVPALRMFEEFKAKQARAELNMLARDIARMIRQHHDESVSNYRTRRDSGYFARKFGNAIDALPEAERATYAAALQRIERIDAWDVSANALETARRDVETARSYGTQYPGDAMRHYSDALRRARDAQTSGYAHPAFARRHAEELSEIEREAGGAIESMRAEIAARNARVIDEWKAGISNVRPAYEAGTFARIKGNTVETSRGAVVPLRHACRLARIARRIIAAGGHEWPEGDGPMIGHFRVTRIGADGSAVIGCHEFEPAESARLLALLESCTDCQRETVASGE